MGGEGRGGEGRGGEGRGGEGRGGEGRGGEGRGGEGRGGEGRGGEGRGGEGRGGEGRGGEGRGGEGRGGEGLIFTNIFPASHHPIRNAIIADAVFGRAWLVEFVTSIMVKSNSFIVYTRDYSSLDCGITRYASLLMTLHYRWDCNY